MVLQERQFCEAYVAFLLERCICQKARTRSSIMYAEHATSFIKRSATSVVALSVAAQLQHYVVIRRPLAQLLRSRQLTTSTRNGKGLPLRVWCSLHSA
jgi:hypothetical protein